MRIPPAHRPLRRRGLGVARRAETLRSANALRAAGLPAVAASVERDLTRRARLGR